MTATTKMASPRAPDRGHAVKDMLTSGVVTACYHASRRQQRPDCERLAMVRYGPTALCAACDRSCSRVGKSMATVAAPDPSALVHVVVAHETCTGADRALRDAVVRARKAGLPRSSAQGGSRDRA